MDHLLRRRYQFIRRYWRYFLASIVFIVICICLITLFQHRKAPEAPVVDPVQGAIAHSTTTPDETTVSVQNYPGVPTGDQPERIAIPALGLDAYIQRVYIDEQGAIASPTNINLVGWYVKSKIPGERGLSVLEGHLDGARQAGAFRHIAELKEGARIAITTVDGKRWSYEVMEVQSYPENEAVNWLFSQDSKVTSQLNLITCAGKFDTEGKRYDQRTIVTAKLSE